MEERTIKMYIINEEGKKITRDVPESLYGTYETIGWKPDNELIKVESIREIKETKESFAKKKKWQ